MNSEDQYLLVRRTGAEPERIALDPAAVCTLGRSQSSTVFLNDVSISRQHAQITFRDGSFWIEDLGSKNGTKVGVRRIDGVTALKPGDRIQLGSVHLVFSGNEPSSSGSARVADVESPSSVVRVVSVDEISSNGAIDTKSFGADLSPERMRNFLQAMDKVGQALLAYRPLDELFQFMVTLVADVLRADRTALLLRRVGSEDELVPMAVSQTGRGVGEEIVVSRTIARMAIGQRQAILTGDAQSDTRFRNQQSVIRERIHSAMCAPLWHEGDVLGLIYVDNVAAPLPFNDGDLQLLTFIAHLAAIKIIQTESYEARQRQEQEIQRAAALQQALLPSEPRQVGTIGIAGSNVASQDVGGDYFDIVDAPSGKLVVGLGDVAGKGMPAALLMSHLSASVKAQVETERPLVEVMRRLNNSIYNNLHRDSSSGHINRFITLVLAEVDTTTGEITYVNGGHNPPFLLRANGTLESLTEGGLLLGIMADAQYTAGSAHLDPGDLIVFYSDGVTEARNLAEEEYGDDRLIAFLRESQTMRPAEMVASLIQNVRTFSRREKPTDDVTVVAMRRA
jgi:serine phosphatase RsbU (regulator of sigma subunit)